jgi:hypothetical protein
LEGCQRIREITRTALKFIGGGLLQDCDNLATVTFEPSDIQYSIPPLLLRTAESSTSRFRATSAESTARVLEDVSNAHNSKLASIESDAFWSSAIETLTIPDSVESIAPANFFKCEDLNTINISRTHKAYECSRDVLWKKGGTEILFAKRTIEGLQILAMVEIIGAYAFCQCRIC